MYHSALTFLMEINLKYLLSLFLSLFITSHAMAEIVPQSEFINHHFGNNAQEKKLWLTGAKKQLVKDILGHKYPKLRVSYWLSDQHKNHSLWVLEEIGKEHPIDVGILVKHNQSQAPVIQQLRILAFRESRGWEVKLPFFTKQFDQVKLNNGQLSEKIDAISGATLSHRAVTKLAKVALSLHSTVFKLESL